MSLPHRLVTAAALLAGLATATDSHALVFRAYLSQNGNDANPCTLPQPCRLLPAALAAVVPAGEIWMLDSANYNTAPVLITKPVTILAVPGALGSVIATNGDAITIDGPGAKVTLRNLVIVHFSNSAHGINFVQGNELNVTDCEISYMAQAGIRAAAVGGLVNVRNSRFRNNAQYGLHAAGSVTVSLDGVQMTGNQYGVLSDNGSRVSVSNSVLSGNSHSGLFAQAFGGTTRVDIINTVSTGNANYGVAAQTVSAGDVLEMTISGSQFSHNSVGIITNHVASSTVTLVLGGNKVTSNTVGVQFVGAATATIYTNLDNTIELNSGGDLLGGTLTTRPTR